MRGLLRVQGASRRAMATFCGSAAPTPASGVPHAPVTRRPRIAYSGLRARDDTHGLGPQASSDAAFVRETLRVDHAGELGALRIYEGQLAVLKALPGWWAPGAPAPATGETPVEAIEHMLDQEREHLAAFERLIPERQGRPTLLAPLWSGAGYAAGAATALCGEKVAMALTAAVETVITGHYNDQLRELHDRGLKDKEAPLRAMLAQFRDDEEQHHATAVHHKALEAPAYAALSKAVEAGCVVAIKLAEKV